MNLPKRNHALRIEKSKPSLKHPNPLRGGRLLFFFQVADLTKNETSENMALRRRIHRKHININLQHDLCFLEFPGSIIPSFVIKLVVLIFLKGRIVIQFEP